MPRSPQWDHLAFFVVMPADRPHTISINHKNYESTDTWRLVHGAVVARRRGCCDGEIMDFKTTMMSWY